MVFNGSGSIVRNQNKSWKFRNYEILRKPDSKKRNFINKKASDIHKYFPGNWTRPNDEVPYIRDGLMAGVKYEIMYLGNKVKLQFFSPWNVSVVACCTDIEFEKSVEFI